MPPIIRVFISPDELHAGRQVSYEEVTSLASTFNRQEALEFLGFLNLLLSNATAETRLTGSLAPVRDVQTWILREIISAPLLADLKRVFGSASLLNRPILHRTQLLFAIRLVASHGKVDGGNCLLTRPDFDAIGDLLFLINGLFRLDAAHRAGAAPLWVATQMAPLYETENPPPIDVSWPRVTELLTNRLRAVAPDPIELERLEQVALFSSGFSSEAWIDLSFMFFSVWGTPTFRELMANRARAYVDPNHPSEVISNEMLRRALDGLGARYDGLPDRLEIGSYTRNALFDLAPFRQKPLWIMPNGQILCADVLVLLERLGPHAFWSMMNALDTPERRRAFTGLWGRAFESYTLDALRKIFAGKKWSLVPNPIDSATNEELADAVALRNDVAIIFECKGTFIAAADKYSGVPLRFFRGLSRKFGNVKHGGVYQLRRGVSRIWLDREAQTPLRTDATQDVFPVMVVQEPALSCGPSVRVLSDRFERALQRVRRRTHAPRPRVWPLTVLTADDVDRLSAAVQVSGVRLDALLKRFHRSNPSRIIAFGDFLASDACSDFGFRGKLNDVIQSRFKAGTAGTLRRIREGVYR